MDLCGGPDTVRAASRRPLAGGALALLVWSLAGAPLVHLLHHDAPHEHRGAKTIWLPAVAQTAVGHHHEAAVRPHRHDAESEHVHDEAAGGKGDHHHSGTPERIPVDQHHGSGSPDHYSAVVAHAIAREVPLVPLRTTFSLLVAPPDSSPVVRIRHSRYGRAPPDPHSVSG